MNQKSYTLKISCTLYQPIVNIEELNCEIFISITSGGSDSPSQHHNGIKTSTAEQTPLSMVGALIAHNKIM